MDENLIGPIEERLALGHTKEDIKREVLSFGYSPAEFEMAFKVAEARAMKAPAPAGAEEGHRFSSSALSGGGQTPSLEQGPPVSPEVSRPSSATKVIVKMVITLLLVGLFVGGAVYAYMAGYIPASVTGIFSKTPYDEEHIVSDIVRSMLDIKSATYKLSASISSVPREDGVYRLPDNLKKVEEEDEFGYEYDMTDYYGQMIPRDFDFSVSVGGSLEVGENKSPNTHTQITAELDTDDLTVNADVEFITTEVKDFYLRINRFPTLFFDLSGIKGEWVKFGRDDMGPFGWEDDAKEVEEGTNEFMDDVKSVMEMVDRHSFVQVVGEPEKETLHDELVFKYQLELNPDTAKAFFEEYKAFLKEDYENDPDFGEYYELYYAEQERDFDFLSNPEVIKYYNQHAPWYVWARPDGTIARVELDATYVPNEEDFPNQADRQINILIGVDFTDVNEQVSVDVPEKAIPLQEAAQKVPMLGSLVGAQTKGEDAAMKSLLSSARLHAEIHYDDNGGSYKGFCESETAVTLISSLREHSDEIDCTDTATDYQFEALLNIGNYYCVDSTGFADELWMSSAGEGQCLTDFTVGGLGSGY